MGSAPRVSKRPKNPPGKVPINMSRIYSYKLSRDFGFAPNPFHGVCTLATCKPQIRKGAQIDDLVIGCGSKALKLEGKIIFAMRVKEKLSFQQYWEDPRFKLKQVDFSSSRSAAYGDNIYHLDNGKWVQEDSHHSHEGGATNQLNLKRDLGSDQVLISDDFVYWGAKAPNMPPHLRDLDGYDLYPNGRNFRCSFTEVFTAGVNAWFENLEDRGNCGRPTSWK